MNNEPALGHSEQGSIRLIRTQRLISVNPLRTCPARRSVFPPSPNTVLPSQAQHYQSHTQKHIKPKPVRNFEKLPTLRRKETRRSVQKFGFMCFDHLGEWVSWQHEKPFTGTPNPKLAWRVLTITALETKCVHCNAIHWLKPTQFLNEFTKGRATPSASRCGDLLFLRTGSKRYF